MNALALCRLTRVFFIAVLMVSALPAWATPLVTESKMDMELREKFQLAEDMDAQEIISFFVKTQKVMETLHLVESLGGTVGTISGDSRSLSS